MKKKTISKTLLIILLCITCALVAAGVAVAIYFGTDGSNVNVTEESDDDGWTNNY